MVGTVGKKRVGRRCCGRRCVGRCALALPLWNNKLCSYSVAHTTLDVTRDRPTETDLKVLPELPLRGQNRLVGAVVEEHE